MKNGEGKVFWASGLVLIERYIFRNIDVVIDIFIKWLFKLRIWWFIYFHKIICLIHVFGMAMNDSSNVPNLQFGSTSDCRFLFQTIPDSKVHGANMGPSGSCWPQMGPMLAPWSLLSGIVSLHSAVNHSKNSNVGPMLQRAFSKAT